MKKILSITCLLSLLVISTNATSEIKKIRLATEGAYAPFNSVDSNGKLVGFDIEIGNALCAQMKAQCEWVSVGWSGLIPGLLAKKYDAIIASMSITEERKKKIAFTDKYYATASRFIRLKGDAVTIDKNSLKGKIIGVQSGTIFEDFIRTKFGDTLEIKTYGSQDEANLDFTAGRVDLLFADAVALVTFLNSAAGKSAEFFGPNYTAKKYFGDGIGIGIHKENQALVDAFNAAIKQIRASGHYQKINASYFNFDLYGE